MKKTLFIISAMAILTGCAKDKLSTADPDSNVISASISDIPSTRTLMIDNPTQKISSSWVAGDVIGIIGNGAPNLQFKVYNITQNAKTAMFIADSSVPTGALLAYYPYNSSVDGSSGSVSLTFPETQKYTLEKGSPQPDPATHFMIADGSKLAGLNFRTAFGYIKGVQNFEKETVISKIEFRDLSGAPVCGPFKMSLNNGVPVTEFTGSGKVITLDCNNQPVMAGADMKFFITVPARKYAQGFEVTFITKENEKIVKTVGKNGGKQIDPGMAYLIGATENRQPLPGSKSTFKDGVVRFTPDMLSRCEIITQETSPAYDDKGKPLTVSGQQILLYDMYMLVPTEFNVTQDGWILVETPTQMLPLGGIFKVDSVEKMSDTQQLVRVITEGNVAAPFKEAYYGTRDAPAEINIANFVNEIVDEEGKSIPFGVSDDGQLLFDEDAASQLFEGETKASNIHGHTFTTPGLSLTMSSGHASLTLGASMTLDTKLCFGMIDGELQYIVFNMNPVLELSSKLAYVAVSKPLADWSKHLFTIKTIPVAVAPGVNIYFEIVFNAIASIDLELELSAGVKFTTDLGKYSVSYNKGDGIAFRNPVPPSYTLSKPELSFDGINGSVSMKAGLEMDASCNIYALCGIGMVTDACLKFGFESGQYKTPTLAFGPDVSFTPKFTAIGGYYTHKFEDFAFSLDLEPLWQMPLYPQVDTFHVAPKITTAEVKEISFPGHSYQWKSVPNGVTGFEYELGVSGPSLLPADLCLDIYTGDNLIFTPVYSLGPFDEDVERFNNNGCNHLIPFLTSDYGANLVNPRKRDRVVLGSYEATDDEKASKRIKGVYNCTTSSGVPIGAQAAFVFGKGIGEQVISFSRNPYNATIYWWPNRSNGQPYYIPPEEQN